MYLYRGMTIEEVSEWVTPGSLCKSGFFTLTPREDAEF